MAPISAAPNLNGHKLDKDYEYALITRRNDWRIQQKKLDYSATRSVTKRNWLRFIFSGSEMWRTGKRSVSR